jgi:hypothetical protein
MKIFAAQRDVVFEITGIHYLRETSQMLVKRAEVHHVWGLIASTLCWTCFDTWGSNASYGFGPILLTYSLVIISNMMACLCLCELISAIPTSGGVAGFARLTMGHYASFLGGVGEAIDFGTNTGTLHI